MSVKKIHCLFFLVLHQRRHLFSVIWSSIVMRKQAFHKLFYLIFLKFQISDSPHLIAATHFNKSYCHTVPHRFCHPLMWGSKGLRSCHRLSWDTSRTINWADSEADLSTLPLASFLCCTRPNSRFQARDLRHRGRRAEAFFRACWRGKHGGFRPGKYNTSQAAQGPTHTNTGS